MKIRCYVFSCPSHNNFTLFSSCHMGDSGRLPKTEYPPLTNRQLRECFMEETVTEFHYPQADLP